MNIDCYSSLGYGPEEALRGNIYKAMTAERVEAQARFRRIDDEPLSRFVRIAFGLR